MSFAKKRVLLLGATGSIGRRTLDVIADFPDLFEVAGISAHRNIAAVLGIVKQHGVKSVCLSDEKAANSIQSDLPSDVALTRGQSGLIELVEQTDADIVLVATVGFAGLRPTLRAIELGRTIALANKEVLVAAGDLVMQEARNHDVNILPVDSEHNAIFQCLMGSRSMVDVDTITLTASGGPFRKRSLAEMKNISVEQALAHPTWNMGRKVSIDSATMMNKGLEVIEAMHLFNMPIERINVLIHPQSVIHSMITFVDGSTIAQLGITDMYLPIQFALTYPARLRNPLPKMDLAAVGTLTFDVPNRDVFPCLELAFQAAAMGGFAGTVLNAANEIAVQRFLNGEIDFMHISKIVAKALEQTPQGLADCIENILELDDEIRGMAILL